VAKINPTSCAHCKAPASDLKQDEDVLDTWFSSGLWPFSTLGWPQKTQALNTFYPTAILETGFDIIFFWVARMIMMGNYFMKQVPFHKVYMHAMVRDEKGEKMSKSKGNVIDPLVIMDQFGTDPLRFTLAAMSGQGRDIKLSVDRVEGYRGFCNKIWNATKFFHLQFEPEQGGPIPEPQGGAEKWLLDHRAELLPANAWILSRLQEVGTRVEKGLTDFELSESAQAIYEFGWHELCDWYIEFSKLPLRKGGEERVQTLITLHYVLETLMRAAHPIMPYVTEELWQSLPWRKFANTPGRKHAGKPTLQTLMVQAFPDRLEEFKNPSIEESIGAKKSVIEAIRNFRGENNLSPKVEFLVRYVAKSPAAEQFVRGSEADLIPLARIKGMQKIDSQDLSARKDVLETVITLAHPALDLHIELAGLVNVEEESKRVRKEMDRVMGDLEFVRNKLGKESFIAKAPAELVAKEKLKEQEYQGQLKELQATLSRLAKLGGTHA
jgi:valyl-tRNA synthetase